MPGVLAHGVVVCPECGAEDLETVSDGESTNFLCVACWSCWHVELGWVQRVDPHRCERCPHRGECLKQFRPPG